MSSNLQERSFPYNLVRKLKVENEDIKTIKQTILKSENTFKKYARNESKKGHFRVRGHPYKGDLCIIHKNFFSNNSRKEFKNKQLYRNSILWFINSLYLSII